MEFNRTLQKKMYIFLALCIDLIATQQSKYFKQIHSISQCLSNCVSCDYNELNGCSPTLDQTCISNYYQDELTGSCIIDDVYQEQVILINQNGDFHNLQNWESTKSTECHYERSSGQMQKISIMGLFLASGTNTVAFHVEPYHQSILISFNLIRNSWVPFLDFLQIQVKDQDKKQLNKFIIQYFERKQIGEEQNTIVCNQERLVVEKFQFSVDFRHKNLSKIHVVFTGLMQGTQLWGFTNFKVAFGCQNNLFYNGMTCLNCELGYYLDTKHVVNGAPTCHQCLPNCLSCSKQRCFTCAQGMIPTGNHCQPAQGFKILDKVYHPTSIVCNITMLHSQSSDIHKQIIDPIKISIQEKHQEARLIFDLYLTDTQWNNQSALIIEIDGRQIKKVRQDKIHNKLRQKCAEFAKGFFSYVKIVTPYFDHSRSEMIFRIYSVDETVTDFGISDVGVEIKLDYSPDPETPPQSQQNMPPPPPPPTPPVIPVVPAPADIPKPTQPVQIIQKKQVIKSILQKKDQVILSHNTLSNRQNNGELIVSINYPFQVTNYPYIYCHFEKLGLHLPGEMISSTYHLQLISVNITKSIVNQTVTVTMSAYRKLVASSQKSNSSSQRNLQENSFSEVELGKIQIKRFDVLDVNELSSMSSLKVMFLTITILFLILTIIFMMVGKGAVIHDLSLLIQLLFLHAYINGQFQPYAFKMPASGFQNMENLNFFAQDTQKSIQSMLLGNVVQESPIRFTQFNTDINFSRAIYPIIIINIIFIIWFFLMKLGHHLLKPRIEKIQNEQTAAYDGKQPIKPTKFQRLHTYVGGIVNRPINYWYFVLKYEYLAMVWICLLQFYGFSYPANSNRNQTINAIFCIICFLVVVCWPVAIYLYIRHNYIIMAYQDYRYEYQNIFYFKLHSRSLPSNHHQYYLLIQPFRQIMYAICCSFLGNSPIQSLTILILIHISSICYLKFGRPIINFAYARFFYIQYALLILLEIVMIAAFAIEEFATKNTYFILGYLMVSICILLVINGNARMIFKIYRMRTHDREDRSTFQGDFVANRAV